MMNNESNLLLRYLSSLGLSILFESDLMSRHIVYILIFMMFYFVNKITITGLIEAFVYIRTMDDNWFHSE
jgi:hypothetical protein